MIIEEKSSEEEATRTTMFAAGHTVAPYASFTSPLLTVDKHPSMR